MAPIVVVHTNFVLLIRLVEGLVGLMGVDPLPPNVNTSVGVIVVVNGSEATKLAVIVTEPDVKRAGPRLNVRLDTAGPLEASPGSGAVVNPVANINAKRRRA